MGVWYEFFRYDEATTKNADCVSANYTLNNTTIEVKNTIKVLPDKTEIVMLGQARLANVTNPMEAKLKIKFNTENEGE